ncbi:MAG: diacylglycerol kinase family protein [Defluviitaleaceae bacterium]|nr:diacylglycerol kinase family protein [Defluviitaleaceae bacterium]MCL2262942.1 diacylglycerol kinase family protein [Defluviitaleaceae bacterium]
MKSRNFIKSLGHAFTGIRAAAARERNFRIQIIAGILAIICCIVFQVDALMFVLVAFAIFFVLAMELVNTAVEAVVDLVTGGKPHPLAKIAKDAAAGAVLLAAAFSVVVAGAVAWAVIRRFI